MAVFSNPAVERGVLSGICKYGREGYLEVSDLVQSSHFTVDLNSGLYSCLAHIFEKDIDTKIDTHLILSTIKDLNLTRVFDQDIAYINNILNFNVELSNIRGYAKKIRKLYETKKISELHKLTQDDLRGITGDEPMSEIIALSENRIFEYTNSLSNNGSEGITHIGTGLKDFIKNTGENPRELVGVSTGYGRLDKAMGGGQRRKSVNVIAARPGIGKTLLADAFSLHAAGKLHIPVLELDTEMDILGHWPRMLASMTHVPIEDIETGRFARDIQSSRKIDKAVKILEGMPLHYMNVAGKEFEEILAIARRWVMQKVGFDAHGVTRDCLFVYDYLKLMNSDSIKDGNIKETQALGFQLDSLNAFVIKYDLPCTTFAQVNRDGITKETGDVIADSDRINRFTANIFLYKVKSPEEIAEDKPENGNRKMCHIKTRYGHGLDGNDYINFQHTKNIGKIEELSTRNDIHAGSTTKKSKKGFEMDNADENPAF